MITKPISMHLREQFVEVISLGIFEESSSLKSPYKTIRISSQTNRVSGHFWLFTKLQTP